MNDELEMTASRFRTRSTRFPPTTLPLKPYVEPNDDTVELISEVVEIE